MSEIYTFVFCSVSLTLVRLTAYSQCVQKYTILGYNLKK